MDIKFKIRISLNLILYHILIGLFIAFFGFKKEKWFIFLGIYVLFLILIILYHIYDRKCLKKRLARTLNNIVKKENLSNITENELFSMITQILIQQQLTSNNILSSYDDYKKQTEIILEYISRGLAIIDNNGSLIFFNSYFAEFLKIEKTQVYRNYKIVIREYELKKLIEATIKTKEQQTKDIEINQKLYQVKIVLLNQDRKEQLLIIIRDLNDHKLLENVKRDFFSYASHELKTPITAIKGYSELIEHQMVNPEEVIKIAHEINHLTELMNFLVEDMLMLSRLEYAKDGLRKDIDLKLILEEILKQLAQSVKDKKITVDLDFEQVIYYADPIDMFKLFKNLIENAVKYNKIGGSIKIVLRKVEKGIEFSVKDSGIGINKEHQVRVFERFYRVSQGREILGTGLGLAIVKHIVLNYDGKISLSSEVGKYTEFVVFLPKSMKE